MPKRQEAYDKEKMLRDASEIFSNSKAAIIKEMTGTMADVAVHGMDRTIKEIGIDVFLEGKFLPYASASVILAFSGKDITKKNIIRLLRAVNIKPEGDMLKVLESLKYRNHMVYVYSLYMLLTIGRDPDPDSLDRIVVALGGKTDGEVAQEIMNLYNNKLAKKWG